MSTPEDRIPVDRADAEAIRDALAELRAAVQKAEVAIARIPMAEPRIIPRRHINQALRPGDARAR